MLIVDGWEWATLWYAGVVAVLAAVPWVAAITGNAWWGRRKRSRVAGRDVERIGRSQKPGRW